MTLDRALCILCPGDIHFYFLIFLLNLYSDLFVCLLLYYCCDNDSCVLFLCFCMVLLNFILIVVRVITSTIIIQKTCLEFSPLEKNSSCEIKQEKN